jgi:hypothetical protein
MNHQLLEAFNRLDDETKDLLCIALGSGVVVKGALECLDDEAKDKLYDALYQTLVDNGGGTFGYAYPQISNSIKEWMWRLNRIQNEL